MRGGLAIIIYLLIALYLGLAYLIFNPKVSNAYRDFFIEKSSNISPFELSRMSEISLGQIIFAGKDSQVGYDNFGPGGDVRLTNNKRSKLIILLNQEAIQNAKGILEFNLAPYGTQRVTFSLNGQEIYSGKLSGPEVLKLTFPASLFIAGKNVIRIDTPDAREKGNGENEILALQLKSFKLE
jgi:hypothetical protein